jgi:hypothetical protein
MQKWEYAQISQSDFDLYFYEQNCKPKFLFKVTLPPTFGSSKNWEIDLKQKISFEINKIAEEGWELIQGNYQDREWYFKRPIEDK